MNICGLYCWRKHFIPRMIAHLHILMCFCVWTMEYGCIVSLVVFKKIWQAVFKCNRNVLLNWKQERALSITTHCYISVRAWRIFKVFFLNMVVRHRKNANKLVCSDVWNFVRPVYSKYAHSISTVACVCILKSWKLPILLYLN